MVSLFAVSEYSFIGIYFHNKQLVLKMSLKTKNASQICELVLSNLNE